MLLDAAGVKLHVAHDGGKGAQPLVLLHGFTGLAETWEPVLPALAEGARVVTLDLVGHGGSEAPEDARHYTMDAVVRQLLALADALGIQQADWLGYSLGGRVALALAVAAPRRVRRLVLVGSSPGILDPAERAERAARDAALAERIERGGVEAFVQVWLEQPLFASLRRLGPAWLARQRELRLRHSARGLANAMRGLGPGSMEPLHGRLGEVEAPALLVAGGEDLKFRAIMDAMRDAMPRARRVDIPGAGHACHLERPEPFALEVLRFLGEP